MARIPRPAGLIESTFANAPVATTPDADYAAERAQESEVKRWIQRIRLGDRIFKKWEKRFACADNWEWYEGYQGKDAHKTGDPSQDPYIVNLIFPTIEVKIPSLYFHNPKATVIPRPAREDDSLSMLQDRARLREDTVNTSMTDPDLHLKDHTNLSLKESFFYFGVVEVGYDASFVANPNAGKPILENDTDPDSTIADPDTGLPIQEPPQIPESEWLYIKRIPADAFRVSPRASFILKNCDWCAYFEWVYASDLRKDPSLINRNKIKAGGKWDDDYTGKIDLNDIEAETSTGRVNAEEMPKKQGMVKIWRVWDIRTETKFIVPDDGDYYLQLPTPYDPFPFPALKFHERKEGWYPLPPVFNWRSPQAEYNDTRRKEKSHRARADRKYQMTKGSIDPDEKDKLMSGGDMTIIDTNGPIPAIVPIEDAPLDAAVSRNVMVTKVDFLEITASGSDQRQVAQSETATQAQVIENRARIRESFGQSQIAAWVSEIARTMLLTIEKHMTLPFWVVKNVDPLSPTAPIEALRVADLFQQITAEQLGELNYDVVVAAESLSPTNEDIERQRFDEILQVIASNPTLMLMLRTSDALLRRFLSLHGMRNEKMVQQIKIALEVALLAVMGPAVGGLPTDPGESGQKAAGMAAVAGGGAKGGGGGPVSATPGAVLPGLPAIMAQISKQIGTGGTGATGGGQ